MAFITIKIEDSQLEYLDKIASIGHIDSTPERVARHFITQGISKYIESGCVPKLHFQRPARVAKKLPIVETDNGDPF